MSDPSPPRPLELCPHHNLTPYSGIQILQRLQSRWVSTGHQVQTLLSSLKLLIMLHQAAGGILARPFLPTNGPQQLQPNSFLLSPRGPSACAASTGQAMAFTCENELCRELQRACGRNSSSPQTDWLGDFSTDQSGGGPPQVRVYRKA